MAEESKALVSKFDGTDFGYWKMQVTDLLIQKDLYLPLKLEGEKPADMKREVWETMDTKAMSTIRLLLTRNVALSIRNEKTSYSLMQTLSDTYEKPSAVNKFFMMRKLYTQKLLEDGSVSDHISTLIEIFDQLSAVEMQISDEQMAVILLLSLPESWEAIVSGIINQAGNNNLVFSEVRGLILSEDVRRRETGKSSSSALVVDGRGRNQQRGGNGARRKSKKRGKSHGKTCWNCGNKGHWKKDCKEKKKSDENQSSSGNVAEVTETSSTDGDDNVLAATISFTGDEWILDSGCTYHMTPHREYFSTYQEVGSGKVYMGNNSECRVAGVGTVEIKMHDGVVRPLTEVRHVPELKKNLISLGVLDSLGCRAVIEDGAMKIVRGALVMMRCTRKNNLYYLVGSTMVGSAAVGTGFSDSETTRLWHMRLGHISERRMNILSQRGLLDGQKTSKLDFCEHCVFGKQRKVKFVKGVHRTEGILDYIHSDLWGPAPI